MLRLLLGALGGFVGLLIAYFAWFAFVSRPRRRKEPGFDYVWVDDDGEARELDADERAYLSARRSTQLTAHGHMSRSATSRERPTGA